MPINRSIELHFKRLLKQYPVVIVTGPRQSGKTTLCKKLLKNWNYINLENIQHREIANHDPQSLFTEFPQNLIIDEIQYAPNLTSYIQTIVDEKNQAGMFVLTGSQQFELMQSINQSLAGRVAILRLLPFSYKEIYNSTNKSIEEVLYKGFYPRIHDKKLNPTEALSFYTNTYIERDVRTLINVKNLKLFERFLGLCAGRVGQIINMTSLSNDCGVDQKTIQSWLSVLEASFIIFLLQPHFKNFNKRIIKSPKLYFYDVGLASFLLGIQNKKNLNNHPLAGNLFENFVIAEILKLRFNQVKTQNLYFFRDNVGNEIDLILDYGHEVIPIEIKLSQTFSQNFIKNIKYYSKLNDNIKNSYVIYGGKNKFEFKNTQILPFSSIPTLKL